MSHRVTMTRTRLIEEKVVVSVDATEADDASATAKHLIDSGCAKWKYNRTLETSHTSVDTQELPRA